MSELAHDLKNELRLKDLMRQGYFRGRATLNVV